MKTQTAQGAAANRRSAGRSGSSGNLPATLAIYWVFPAAVAELPDLRILHLALFALLLGGSACSLFGCFRASPNRALVRNSSGVGIHQVRLELRDLQDKPFLDERIGDLLPGQQVIFQHQQNASKAHLTFLLEGKIHEFDEPYIDLWTGEGWLFDVLPGGEIRTGYDPQRRD